MYVLAVVSMHPEPGTTIPLIAYAAALLVLTCRALDVSIARYTLYVVPRPLLGAIPTALVLLWFKFSLDVRGIVGLVSAGISMLAVFGLTWILFVYHNDPYLDLRSRLLVLRSWRRA